MRFIRTYGVEALRLATVINNPELDILLSQYAISTKQLYTVIQAYKRTNRTYKALRVNRIINQIYTNVLRKQIEIYYTTYLNATNCT